MSRAAANSGARVSFRTAISSEKRGPLPYAAFSSSLTNLGPKLQHHSNRCLQSRQLRDLSTALFAACRRARSRIALLVESSSPQVNGLTLCGSQRKPISVPSERGNDDYPRTNPFGSNKRLTRQRCWSYAYRTQLAIFGTLFSDVRGQVQNGRYHSSKRNLPRVPLRSPPTS